MNMRAINVLLLVALVAVAYASARTGVARTRVVHEAGMISPATVEYDVRGVPYVQAESERDMFFTQGLVAAEYRLWQLDFITRLVSGRLAEIFGPPLLEIDIEFRRMQFAKVCEENVKNTPQEYLDGVNAYVDGVNTFLEQCRNNPSQSPIEYQQYDAALPQNFTAVSTFFVLKAMSTGLSHNADLEVGNEQLLSQIGQERFNFFQSRDPRQPTIVGPYSHSKYTNGLKPGPPLAKHNHVEPDSFEQLEVDEDTLMEIGMVRSAYDRALAAVNKHTKFQTKNSELSRTLAVLKTDDVTYASNNWAVGAQHTDSGKAVVASDPHLPYFLPSIWIYMGVHCTNTSSRFNNHLFGATIIGAPGIGIGGNQNISWAYTTNDADTQDLFKMQNNADNTGYFYKGQEIPYETVVEEFEVAGQGTVEHTFMNSIYGPVTVDGDNYYSLHWAVLGDVDTSVEALFLTNMARNWDEWRQGCSQWMGMLFNAAFGDDTGKVGIQIVGNRIPIRPQGSFGIVPQPGNGSYDWLGYIPFEDLPHVYDPPQGFVVSANNPPDTFANEKYPLPGPYAPGFRAQRIIDLLMDAIDAGEKITMAYNGQIQNDVLTLPYWYLRPALEALELSSEAAKDRQSMLLSWDGNEVTSSKEARTFEAWFECLRDVTQKELDGTTITNPWLTAAWFNHPDSDDPTPLVCSVWGQTCVEYASNCFEQVTADVSTRRYGMTHYALMSHLLPLPIEWNRAVSIGGDPWTPNCASLAVSVGNTELQLVIAGPSMRMLTEVGSLNSSCVLPGGESGDPKSPFYDDMIQEWANGEYITMGWKSIN